MPTNVEELFSGPLWWFRDWPNRLVPRAAAGVYTVWSADRLVYVGMSGRGKSQEEIARRLASGGKPLGIYERLASHASGNRSGDQFCVYVADRFVLPLLTPEDVRVIAAGEHAMDASSGASSMPSWLTDLSPR